MSSRTPFLLLAGLSLLGALAPPVEAQAAVYRIRIVESHELRLHVDATIGAGERIAVSDYGAWSQPRGWATFIEGLQVADSSGPLEASPIDGGWQVAATEDERFELSYEVDLSHAAWPEWPDGPRTTSAFEESGAAFALMGALLVFSSEDEPCEISFEGSGWGHVVAPFEVLRPGAYQVASVRRATENVFAFGELEVAELVVGSMHVQLLLVGDALRAGPLFAEVTSAALENYAALFETELVGDYLAIVYSDRWYTAEAYEDSFVLATTTPLTDENVAIWGQTVAHELFHRWNGHLIRGEIWSESNWFLEGVTDYVASLFLVRRGFVGADVFLDQLEKHVAFYKLYHKGAPFAGLDLVAAGANKGVNNAALYDGGWLTAFAIDVELQDRTGGDLGIEEFLQRLLEWSTAASRGYDGEVLIGLLNELSASDFRPFFQRHIEDTQPLDLRELCQRAGIELRVGAEQAHARIHPAPKQAAAAIRDRLLRGAFDASARELSRQVDALLEEYTAPASPGASLTVCRAGRIVHSRGYGLADLERPHPIRPDTVFHAASVSKQFTAFLIFLLEGEGRLSTDDLVLEWVPELRCAQGVRIRHLLDHTSGLRDQWQLLGLRGVRPNGDVIEQDDVLALLYRQEELSFAPGTQQAYCNSGYTVLAEIASRAAGAPFPRLAHERIFEPLGMSDTRFQDSPRPLRGGRALSYGRVSGERFESVPIAFGTYGATGLMTTTEDLVRWARNAWELRIGSASLYARMLERGKLDDGTELNFTNGLQVRTWRGYELYGHPGSDAGYRSAVLSVPEERVVVALLGNVDSVDMWGLPDRVLSVFLPDRSEPVPDGPEEDAAEDDPPVQPEPTQLSTELNDLVGRYYSRELDSSYDLEVNEGQLSAEHIRNGAHFLEPAGTDRFRCDRWYLNEISIERDAEGTAVAFRASSARSRGVRFVRQ